MARIFITGSADGLGLLAAKALVSQGHKVVLHARNEPRKLDAIRNVAGAETAVTGDLSDIEETKRLAAKVNELGAFDVVMHNAGVYRVPGKTIFAVNTLAPYMLTCLIQKPKRLIYLSSGMQAHGRANLEKFRPDASGISYSDSKLHVLMLSMEVASRWSDVYSNTVDPGWVPTKMGGKGAPDDLQKGYETQVWLAVSEDQDAKVSGRFFFHKKQKRYNPEADNATIRAKFLAVCGEVTGVAFPK
jgi:NAD(P)-dependent dehydrogenase (short-subunit alcohol dehydrogenase family)